MSLPLITYYELNGEREINGQGVLKTPVGKVTARGRNIRERIADKLLERQGIIPFALGGVHIEPPLQQWRSEIRPGRLIIETPLQPKGVGVLEIDF